MKHLLYVSSFCFVLLACGDDDAPADTGTPDMGDAEPGPVSGIDFEAITLPDSVATLTAIAFLPGEASGAQDLLALSHEGTVHHLRIEGTTATSVGQFTVPNVVQMGDCGLVQVAIDPDWQTNRFIYLGYCAEDTNTVVTRFEFDGTNHDTAAASASELLRVAAPFATGNHAIGNIGFEADGQTMFVSIGDKATEDGQDTTNLLSSLLRIVPSRETPATFTPAGGNAFEEGGDNRPEIYAYGLRNGWRTVLDSRGRYWIGDVGEGAEELNLVTEAGQNFGWRLCDGPCDPPMAGIKPALASWARGDHPYFRDDPELSTSPRRSVWVGEENRPIADDPYEGFLAERIPFGDLCLGFVRLAWSEDGDSFSEDMHVGNLAHITSWVQANDGMMYASTFGSCDSTDVFDPAGIYRVVPTR